MRQQRGDWAETLMWWSLGGPYEKSARRNLKLISPEALTALLEESYTELEPQEPLKFGTRLYELWKEWERPWPHSAAGIILHLFDEQLKNHTPSKIPNRQLKLNTLKFLSLMPHTVAAQYRDIAKRHRQRQPNWREILDHGLIALDYQQTLVDMTSDTL